jgi:hypothetical protein
VTAEEFEQDNQQFVADHSGATEQALRVMLRNGDRAAAAIFIDEVRARHPEFGDELAAKYAKELDR